MRLHIDGPLGGRLWLTVVVVGAVYCYKCYNWKYPVDSHIKKLFKGAVVKVTCKVGHDAYVGYGVTKKYGKYSVDIKGYPYWKYGAEGCKVELHAAPKGSVCNIPTHLNMGAKLIVKSKTHEEIVLKAKSLAYAPKKPYMECEKPKPPVYYYKSPPPPYYYNSPPPPVKSPPPPYYYKSPPPPSPSPPPPYYYKSPPPPSPSPPPPYYYKSPPPPEKSPPPPYHYSSPPPPTIRPSHLLFQNQVS
ncbi:hypothetical protein J5N97_012490 [Dioscorea zingiberensis]|uniref:Extensin domain-containing protein n=1 Tax=Dioscorea zingiberensis TaxID=325984 RepID=A0A9D5CP20_9LILI|nr:hypothetical protein J5N97_012490 [Dioscorea zingiberensis]